MFLKHSKLSCGKKLVMQINPENANRALISWQAVGELEISAWREELGSGGRNVWIGPAQLRRRKEGPEPRLWRGLFSLRGLFHP